MAPESLTADAGVVTTADAEVLSTPDHLVAPAADALGWCGVVLAPETLLGRRVAVVAELIPEVHERRAAAGWGPVCDRTSVAMWDWPEMRHRAPAPAVRLSGVIAPGRHWRTGLAAAVGFAGLCPAAVLLPAEAARDGECSSYAEHFGLAVVASACAPSGPEVDVDVVREGRCAARRAAMGRWVHEVVYERVLAASPC